MIFFFFGIFCQVSHHSDAALQMLFSSVWFVKSIKTVIYHQTPSEEL
jgi:hypothetical protein